MRSPEHRVDGLRALAVVVGGQQPSPNAELVVARDVALAAELLALRGLIAVDRTPGRPGFSLTRLGQAFMRPQARPAIPALSSALALTTALSGCAHLMTPAAPPLANASSLQDLRQRTPSRIEQVVDPYNGYSYFARCTDCAKPTPKTLASQPNATANADITRFIAPDILARAQGAEGSANPAQGKQLLQSPDSPATAFVERRYVVYFKFAEGGVDPVAQLALQKIASQLTGAKSILIVGSTDSAGTAASNQRLADRRAKSVSAVLAKAGVPGSGIETKAEPNRAGSVTTGAALVGKAVSPSPAALARHAEIVALVPAAEARVAALSR